MIPARLRRTASGYNLGEMSIYLGIFAALLAFMVILAGVAVAALTPLRSAPVGWTCFGIWCAGVLWLWTCFVIIGRTNANGRTSTFDLTVIQVIWLAVLAWGFLTGPTQMRDSFEFVEMLFEGAGMLLHVVYFSLAWAMRARVPLKTYVLSAALLVLLVLRSLWIPVPTWGSRDVEQRLRILRRDHQQRPRRT